MPVTDGYIEFVRDLLASLEPLRIRRMFGGAGIYSADLFFAILVDDTLYFKVDVRTRGKYEVRGSRQFTYTMKNGRTASMSYYPVPPEILDDSDALVVWARDAVEVAKRAARKQSARRQPARSGRKARRNQP